MELIVQEENDLYDFKCTHCGALLRAHHTTLEEAAVFQSRVYNCPQCQNQLRITRTMKYTLGAPLPPRLRTYRFSLGNSTTGQIGFCVDVQATSAQEAVALLQKSLPCEAGWASGALPTVVKHGVLYFNPKMITTANIVMVDDKDWIPGKPVKKRTKRA